MPVHLDGSGGRAEDHEELVACIVSSSFCNTHSISMSPWPLRRMRFAAGTLDRL